MSKVACDHFITIAVMYCIGLLNPLDCPHHMRQDDLCPYREGVVLEDSSQLLGSSTHSLVDCGLNEVWNVTVT